MARTRGGGGRSIRDVTADWLRRLTSFFRLGPFGSREAGQPTEPSRPRLETVAEIVEEQRVEAMRLPSVGEQRWRWSFVCIWYDADTGDRIGEWRWNVETDRQNQYDRAYSDARRRSQRHTPACIQREMDRGRRLRLSCRKIGTPILL